MADEREVIGQDEHHYFAITHPGGLAEYGAIAVLEIGLLANGFSDPNAQLLLLGKDACELIMCRLQNALLGAYEKEMQ